MLRRLDYARLVERTTVRARTVAALVGASPPRCCWEWSPAALLITAAVLAGTARGVFTLLHATAITDRWGTRHYGRLSGLLQAPLAVTAAVSPRIATAVAAHLGGYPAVFALLAAAGAVAALLSTRSVPAGAH